MVPRITAVPYRQQSVSMYRYEVSYLPRGTRYQVYEYLVVIFPHAFNKISNPETRGYLVWPADRHAATLLPYFFRSFFCSSFFQSSGLFALRTSSAKQCWYYLFVRKRDFCVTLIPVFLPQDTEIPPLPETCPLEGPIDASDIATFIKPVPGK